MYVGSSDEPRIVSFDGTRPGQAAAPRRFDDRRSATVADITQQDLFVDAQGGLHAAWVTAGKGCPRTTSSASSTATPRAGGRFEPTEILQAVSPAQARLELPEITDYWQVVWVERREGASIGAIHLSR